MAIAEQIAISSEYIPIEPPIQCQLLYFGKECHGIVTEENHRYYNVIFSINGEEKESRVPKATVTLFTPTIILAMAPHDRPKRTQTLFLDQISREHDTQRRAGGVDEATIKAYTEVLLNGGKLPALKVVATEGGFILWDGFHTFSALERSGIAAWDCEIILGSIEDAQDLACSANNDHGRPRSNEDKRNTVMWAYRQARHRFTQSPSGDLIEVPYSKIAKLCSVSQPFVKKIRESPEAIEEFGPAPETCLVERSGQVYEMKKAPRKSLAEVQELYQEYGEIESVWDATKLFQNCKMVAQFKSLEDAAEKFPEVSRRLTKLADLPTDAPTIFDAGDYAEASIPKRLEMPPALEPEVFDATEFIEESRPIGKPSNEKYTPPLWADFVREVFGGEIELDPASSPEANTVIQARRFFTIEDNALEQEWACETLFLNPPYSMPEIENFAFHLLTQVGHIGEFVVLVNACTDTSWFQTLANECQAILFPSGRINFWAPGSDPENIKGANEYRQAFLYRGPNAARFKELGNPLGLVVEVCQ